MTAAVKYRTIVADPPWPLRRRAHSLAWAAFDLPVPYKKGGWVTNLEGGWSAYVEQGRYGHPMRKATWLCTRSNKSAHMP